jgi:hypothetical protein
METQILTDENRTLIHILISLSSAGLTRTDYSPS